MEIGLHQRLDIYHLEDQCRVRKPKSMRVMGMCRRFSKTCSCIDDFDRKSRNTKPPPISPAPCMPNIILLPSAASMPRNQTSKPFRELTGKARFDYKFAVDSQFEAALSSQPRWQRHGGTRRPSVAGGFRPILTSTRAMTAGQKIFIGAALAAALGTGVFEAHQNAQLREQLQQLQQAQASLAETVAQLRQEQLYSVRQSRAAHPALDPSAEPKAQGTPTAFRHPHPLADATPIPSKSVIAEIQQALTESTWGGRDDALRRLAKLIASADIPQALAYLAQKPGLDGVGTPLYAELASRWGSEDHDAAVAWAKSLSDPDAQKQAFIQVLKGWSDQSPSDAANYLVTMTPGDVQNACMGKVLGEWSFRDGQAAVQWVTQFLGQYPQSDLTDKAVDSVMFWAQGQSPAAIADLLDTSGNPNLVQKYGEQIGSIWLSRDETAARAWIQRSSLPDDVKQRLLNRN